jgi:choline dehydrogenase-like flavoprotein
MFIDSRDVHEGQVFESDICVIGAGAAGITLARPLANAGFSVSLLESGGFEVELPTQAMTAARIAGGAGLVPTLRLRYFGGTTNHWGGWCRPLETFDFEPHDWIPDSGWPIGLGDLAPYYQRAKKLLGIGRPHFRFDPSERGAAGGPSLLADSELGFEPVVWRLTQPSPTNMGKGKFRKFIGRHPKIRCFLHTNATQLIPDISGRTIRSLDAASLSGRKFAFRARRYVLCMGAIANARLLLLSDSVIPVGVGNQHDVVGRYFSDHGYLHGDLHLNSPSTPGSSPRVFREERFLLADPPRWGRHDGFGFASTPAFRTQHQVLGFSAIANLHPGYREAPPFAAAVEDLASGQEVDAEDDGAAKSTRSFKLVIVPEQAPNRESRLRLHRDKDALGLRQVELDLKPMAIDFESRKRSAWLFGLAVARSGSGRVHFEDLESTYWSLGGNGHQTGTTRMSDDPKRGVTDRNAKVHGVANLYVAGGSLFPTAGYQHPTMNFMALTLRLADRLKATTSPA